MGREPFINKWSLVSGVGYAKKRKTVEEGVIDEVSWDIRAIPFDIKKLFSINKNSQKMVVFSAKVNEEHVAPTPPHVVDIKWCTDDELRNFEDLAFEHQYVLKRYLSARGSS